MKKLLVILLLSVPLFAEGDASKNDPCKQTTDGGYVVVAFATQQGALVYLQSLPESQRATAFLIPLQVPQQFPRYIVLVNRCDWKETPEVEKK